MKMNKNCEQSEKKCEGLSCILRCTNEDTTEEEYTK